jgi:hypothetical protein
MLTRFVSQVRCSAVIQHMNRKVLLLQEEDTVCTANNDTCNRNRPSCSITHTGEIDIIHPWYTLRNVQTQNFRGSRSFKVSPKHQWQGSHLRHHFAGSSASNIAFTMGNAQSFGSDKIGFQVTSVSANSPGEAAGLLVTEDFILTLNGQALPFMETEKIMSTVKVRPGCVVCSTT